MQDVAAPFAVNPLKFCEYEYVASLVFSSNTGVALSIAALVAA
ncbi:unannotated protein [freshwater metagenome]|uniref:Unannotated protein n=1 Tax=freshwater metagenome TaxID=449393 RepID=A0A6J6WKX4_9ZZZZ